MKVKNTTTILLSTIFIISAFALVVYAQHEHGMEMEHGGKASDKARCAIEGMEMKKSAMVKMEHNGGTLYFCSKEQMEMFKKNPTKYLKVISIGDVDVNLNILTMKEHKDIMDTMGMGGMMNMKGMGKATHYISAYLTDKKTGASIATHSVDNIQIVITSPDGKVQKPQMKFVDMMKYHAAGFNLAKSGNYKIKVILEAADIEYKI
jgi:YHS domain-containing protein